MENLSSSSYPKNLPSSMPPAKPKSRFASLVSHHAREPVDSYRPGGYHPVHFGDFLCNGRYEVVRKLGFGETSTVWLARNTSGYIADLCSAGDRSSRYLAVKIKKAEESTGNSELSILRYINQKGSSDRRSIHVIALLDSFEQQGPNGKHLCLVSEALGPSVATVLEWTPSYRSLDRAGKNCYRFPLWICKRILKQVLLGIAYLHAHGVVHGDIHAGNVLFVTAPILDKDQFNQIDNSGNMALTRLDGTPDAWAPRYIPIARPLIRQTHRSSDFMIKISDLGSAFRYPAPYPPHPATPEPLRAPEQILHTAPLTSSIDIWSFGCLLYSSVTGRNIFPSYDISPERYDDAHLLDMIDRLGALPPLFFLAWPRCEKYFRASGKLYNSMVGGKPGKWILAERETLEEAFEREKPIEEEFSEEQGRKVLNLLRLVLKYEPWERPGAEEILRHVWFKDEGL